MATLRDAKQAADAAAAAAASASQAQTADLIANVGALQGAQTSLATAVATLQDAKQAADAAAAAAAQRRSDASAAAAAPSATQDHAGRHDMHAARHIENICDAYTAIKINNVRTRISAMTKATTNFEIMKKYYPELMEIGGENIDLDSAVEHELRSSENNKMSIKRDPTL